MGKRGKNRKQQLREIQQRRLRYQPKMPQVPFSWGRFLSQHTSEIFFIGCFILAITLVYSLANKKEDSSQLEALNSSVSQEQINALGQTYPQGFRVFVLTDNKVLALGVDTLPKDLNINWGVSKIIQLTREEIRFQIGAISYQSKILTSSLNVKLPRQQGKASHITDINDIQISIDLLGEYDTGVFCALGFKKG